nr:MAG TPA: hypothetical protein [Caudoviricetes sp.]
MRLFVLLHDCLTPFIEFGTGAVMIISFYLRFVIKKI